jgi:hypothetical protein
MRIDEPIGKEGRATPMTRRWRKRRSTRSQS